MVHHPCELVGLFEGLVVGLFSGDVVWLLWVIPPPNARQQPQPRVQPHILKKMRTISTNQKSYLLTYSEPNVFYGVFEFEQFDLKP